MASLSRVPVSALLADSSADNGEEPKKKSREDWRRAKELDEARKAGTAPAAVDEEGRDINPHIPQYISNAPWYYNASGPTLRHQRPQDEETEQQIALDEYVPKGINTKHVVTKFRKGACENCGAMTHKKKDCMERPRVIGAKYTGALIAHDEFLQNGSKGGDYDTKRDRWNGYDPESHKDIIEEFHKIEEAKQKLKAEKLKTNPDVELSDNDQDEDKYVDEVDMPGTKVDSKQRITVRNLRIREDTAKYLRNLDPNSAYYDPKTRSMRDNPNPKIKADETDFAGENFVRFSGDTQHHSNAQLFAWEAYGKGVDVHLLAEPTKLELLQQEYEKKKEELKSETKETILDKYGGSEHLDAIPKTLLLAQTEHYVEYSRSGKVIKGQEKQKIKSRFEEDVLINNHTSVWGSFWSTGRWGFKCCRSFIKNSYCITGGAVQEVNKEQGSFLTPPPPVVDEEKEYFTQDANEPFEEPSTSATNAAESSSDDEHRHSKKSKKKQKKNKKKKKSSKKECEKDKLKKALELEEKLQNDVIKDDRKRSYNSMYEVKQPTEEEIEAYLMKRKRDFDPMSQFVEK